MNSMCQCCWDHTACANVARVAQCVTGSLGCAGVLGSCSKCQDCWDHTACGRVTGVTQRVLEREISTQDTQCPIFIYLFFYL